MLAMDLSGRRALVTGGSRGIGAACCHLLARAGAEVGVHCRADLVAAREVAALASRHGVRSSVLQADLSRPGEAARLFARMEETLGPPEIVVLSAGIWKPAPIVRMTAEMLDETLAVNLSGVFHACREAARRFPGGRGTIVTISSTAGQRGEPLHSHYAASKGAVIALTRSLAVELAPEVRVNSVAPGWVETDMTREALADPDRRARILAEIPLGRIASPEDVASAVVFLASDLARHVTGAVLNVNGGSVLC